MLDIPRNCMILSSRWRSSSPLNRKVNRLPLSPTRLHVTESSKFKLYPQPSLSESSSYYFNNKLNGNASKHVICLKYFGWFPPILRTINFLLRCHQIDLYRTINIIQQLYLRSQRWYKKIYWKMFSNSFLNFLGLVLVGRTTIVPSKREIWMPTKFF